MKRLTAVLTAALIALIVSTTAFAAPTNQDDKEQSGTSSAESEQKENSEKTENDSLDPEKLKYTEYTPENTGMRISLPSDMYILTPDISKDDPALAAVKMKKEDVEKSFAENGTLLKAFAKDFSYDITLTLSQSDKTEEIKNLSSLSESEIDKITDALLKSDYTVGCSINTYNNIPFLSLDTEYKSGDTTIYGVQEYTIVNGKNIIITFQSHTGKLTQNQQTLIGKIMEQTFFEGNKPAAEVSDIASTNINKLDSRYIAILISSIIGLIALASIIIVGTKYRQSRLAASEKSNDEHSTDDNKFIIKTPNTRIVVDDINDDIEQKKTDNEEKPYDTSLFAPSDENVLFKNEKLEEEKKQKEKTRNVPRLDSTTELSIPKNPYTPVGKAEAVEQPAMSITSEFAKLSNISAEDAKAAKNAITEEKNDNSENDDGIVFAESTPKPKTEIEQIGEDVFIKHNDPSESSEEKVKNTQEEKDIQDDIFSGAEEETVLTDIPTEDVQEETEKELSEYEKRFGKGRTSLAQGMSDSADDSEKQVSKFEKHFGKLQPAAQVQSPTNNTMSAVDAIIKHEGLAGGEDDDLIQDKSPITITKAPPKAPEPTVSEQPVVRITKTTPMPAGITAETLKPEAEPEQNNSDIPRTDNTKSTDGEPEKKTIFQKFTESLFTADEPDEERPVETNKQSTNKFINSLRDKLQYRNPEFESQSQTPDKSSDGTEIYRSPETDKSKQIELSIKKNEDGSLVVDSISDRTGKPVQIELKDGNAELRAKAEKTVKSSGNKDKTASDSGDSKNEKADNKKGSGVIGAAAAAIGTAVSTTETAAEIVAAAVGTTAAAANITAETAVINTVTDTAQKAESAAATIKTTEAVIEGSKSETSNKPSSEETVDTAEAAETSASGNSDVQETVNEGIKTETTEEKTVVENTTDVSDDIEEKAKDSEEEALPEIKTNEAKVQTDREESESVPDDGKTESHGDENTTDISDDIEEKAKDSDEEALPEIKTNEAKVQTDREETEAVQDDGKTESHGDDNSEEDEKEAPKPSEPEFVFERDTGIVFERAISPAESFRGTTTPLTSIPRLESVNANDYNKQIEEMRKRNSVNPMTRPRQEIQHPPVQTEQDSYYDNNEDDTLDPFAPGSQEMTLKEIDKKTSPKLGERLKKSIGKIFSGTDDEN